VFERWDGAAPLLAMLAERFAVDLEPFEACTWWLSGGQSVWVTHRDVSIDGLEGLESVGLVVMRRPPPRGQLTAPFLRRFAQSAQRNVVTLSDDAVVRYFAGEDLLIDSEGVFMDASASEGMMIVRSRLGVIGRGRWSDAVLRCELPKESRIDAL
jgi:hypothetical protein